MKKIIFTVLMFLLLGGGQFVFADALILNDGKVVEGEITLETAVFVRIIPKGRAFEKEEYLHENIKEKIVGRYVAPKPDIVELPLEELKETFKEELKVAQEILTNETINEVISQPNAEGAGSYAVLESNNSGGGEQNVEKMMTPKMLQDMQGEMEKMLEMSLKEQVSGLLGGVLKFFLIILFIVGLIAFFINRAIDVGLSEEELKPAGFFRRIIAFIIDSSIVSAILSFVIILLGLLIPLDSKTAIPIYVVVVLAAGLGSLYVALGCSLFSNTYGRYVVNIKVIDVPSGQKPRVGQAIVRMIPTLLWPIEGMVTILSKSKRRIGDAWAKTRVVVAESKKSFIARASIGVVIIAVGFVVSFVVGPIASNNMLIVADVRQYLQRSNVKFVGNPQNVQINATPQQTQGAVTFKLDAQDGKSVVVLMAKEKGKWHVTQVKYIKKKYFGLMTVTY